MHIGVDACCWANRRGYGRFTRELLTALIATDRKNNYCFFVDQANSAISEFPDGVNKIIVNTSISPLEAASASGNRSVRDVWAMTRQVLKHDLNLFFFPTVYSYFPILNQSKIALTIHDMIPDSHPAEVFPNRKRKFFWRLKQFMALRQADLILTVSEYSKREILHYCRLRDAQVRVVPEAPGVAFKQLPHDEQMMQALKRYQFPPTQRFLLHVGGISPHKNLKTLIHVFSRLIGEASFSDLKLVLVGDYTTDSFYSDYPALRLQIDQLSLAEKVIFTGFVSDDELAILYNAALLVVFPSFAEGFGLPAIEAMACGTPVAASNAGSLPETLAEAGRFFDPHNSAQMLDTVRRILTDDTLRQEMKQRGLNRSKQFQWSKASETLLSIFEEMKKQ